jgi:hypothetical protein
LIVKRVRRREYARQSVAALVVKSCFIAVEAGLQQRLAEEMVVASESLISLAGGS